MPPGWPGVSVVVALSSAVGAVGILPIVAILIGIVGAAAVFGWPRMVSRRTADADQS
nr:hypothetical protein [Mycobacterium sp.]